jgi:hypothetical protein
VPNSLLAGKNAGNFADSAAFQVILSRKHLQMQWFADKFPTPRAGNYLARAGNLFRAQGICAKSIRTPICENSFLCWII